MMNTVKAGDSPKTDPNGEKPTQGCKCMVSKWSKQEIAWLNSYLSCFTTAQNMHTVGNFWSTLFHDYWAAFPAPGMDNVDALGEKEAASLLNEMSKCCSQLRNWFNNCAHEQKGTTPINVIVDPSDGTAPVVISSNNVKPKCKHSPCFLTMEQIFSTLFYDELIHPQLVAEENLYCQANKVKKCPRNMVMSISQRCTKEAWVKAQNSLPNVCHQVQEKYALERATKVKNKEEEVDGDEDGGGGVEAEAEAEGEEGATSLSAASSLTDTLDKLKDSMAQVQYLQGAERSKQVPLILTKLGKMFTSKVLSMWMFVGMVPDLKRPGSLLCLSLNVGQNSNGFHFHEAYPGYGQNVLGPLMEFSHDVIASTFSINKLSSDGTLMTSPQDMETFLNQSMLPAVTSHSVQPTLAKMPLPVDPSISADYPQLAPTVDLPAAAISIQMPLSVSNAAPNKNPSARDVPTQNSQLMITPLPKSLTSSLLPSLTSSLSSTEVPSVPMTMSSPSSSATFLNISGNPDNNLLFHMDFEPLSFDLAKDILQMNLSAVTGSEDSSVTFFQGSKNVPNDFCAFNPLIPSVHISADLPVQSSINSAGETSVSKDSTPPAQPAVNDSITGVPSIATELDKVVYPRQTSLSTPLFNVCSLFDCNADESDEGFQVFPFTAIENSLRIRGVERRRS
ncbi:hypothetical protein GYMLUDRAFT_244172 [Collybiopsis luxurians FD-317 M1]|uniref:Unplaced genomic scaffold GYMLUscaffold_26, whole genome shotgun sequence n=1 Tax=Collybiopsis luxurians FD-317 M1 TaxID=944289 RepID=A0A0D0CWT5_9AGAR|nr:hypothetical protein GYMLUDRAFT_244172 [Collybiopsis luxurians FD-317 M1]